MVSVTFFMCIFNYGYNMEVNTRTLKIQCSKVRYSLSKLMGNCYPVIFTRLNIGKTGADTYHEIVTAQLNINSSWE